MAGLTDLPLEILDLVISFYTTPTDQHILVKLCRVSKKLCAVAQPWLFRNYMPLRPRPFRNAGTSYNFQSYLGSVPKRPLMYFAHTLVSRPHLALVVRHIAIESFDDDDLYDVENEESLPVPSSEMMENFQRAVERLDLPEQSSTQWITNIMSFKVTAFIALLLSQTPNLKSLRVVLDSNPLDDLNSLIARQVAEPESTFPRFCSMLTKVDATCAKFRRWFRLSGATPLLCLPALETFCADHTLALDGNLDGDTAELVIEPRTLNISNLKLLESSLDEKSFRSLFSGCKDLRAVQFICDNPSPFAENARKQINAPELESAIYGQRHTLEELRVSFGRINIRHMSGQQHLPFDSFAGFTRLRRLNLQYFYMVGEKDLPASLEHLIIRQCESGVFMDIARLAGICPRMYPSLRKVEVDQPSNYEIPYLQKWAQVDDLKQACKKMVSVLRGTDICLFAAASQSINDGKPNFSRSTPATARIDGRGFHIEIAPVQAFARPPRR